jgi:hypothetical protein
VYYIFFKLIKSVELSAVNVVDAENEVIQKYSIKKENILKIVLVK